MIMDWRRYGQSYSNAVTHMRKVDMAAIEIKLRLHDVSNVGTNVGTNVGGNVGSKCLSLSVLATRHDKPSNVVGRKMSKCWLNVRHMGKSF